MVRCPLCFTQLAQQYAKYVCMTPSCQPKPDAPTDEQASRYVGTKVAMRTYLTPEPLPDGTLPQAPPVCLTCSTPAYARVCPYCNFGPLQTDWMSSHVTCVAMAGARFTGKSFYVAVAIRQLQLLGLRVGVAVDFANEATRKVYTSNYENPLYVDRGMIPPTAAMATGGSHQRDPQIYSLGLVRGQRHYLVLRDVAGEDLESEQADTQFLQFIANADTVLFMFDPWGVAAVVDQLRDLDQEQQFIGGDPQVVLNNVLRIIGSGRPRLAIVIAKFDILHKLINVEGTVMAQIMSNSGAAMLRDPSLDAMSYNEVDGQLLHHEIRSLLMYLNATALLLSLERPTSGNHLEHRFFAVSTLGESIRNQAIAQRGISPSRCLDPLRWALNRTGSL